MLPRKINQNLRKIEEDTNGDGSSATSILTKSGLATIGRISAEERIQSFLSSLVPASWL